MSLNSYLSESKEFYYDYEVLNASIILRKLTLAGAEVWNRTIDLTAFGNEGASIATPITIKEIEDRIAITGNYAIDNGNTNRIFLLWADAQGNAISQSFHGTFNSPSFRSINVISKAASGGHYLLHSTYLHTIGIEQALEKIDINDQQIWFRNIGNSSEQLITGYTKEAQDGSGIYFSYRHNTQQGLYPFITKIGSNDGSTIWSFSPNILLTEQLLYDQSINGLTLAENGDLVFGYTTFSASQTPASYHYARLNPNGNLVWSHQLSHDFGGYAAALATSDGGFIFQKIQDSQIGLFKVNSAGELDPLCPNQNTNCSTIRFGFSFLGTHNGNHYFISDEKATWETAQNIAIDNDGHLASFSTVEENNFILNHISEVVLVGGRDENCDGIFEWADGSNTAFSNISGTCSAANFYTNMNFWNGELSFDSEWTERKYILETACSENRNTAKIKTVPRTSPTPKLYPNPVSDDLFMELETDKGTSHSLKIYSSSGQDLESKDCSFTAGSNRIKLDVHALRPGIYFVNIFDPSGKHRFETMRFVKAK